MLGIVQRAAYSNQITEGVDRIVEQFKKTKYETELIEIVDCSLDVMGNVLVSH